MTEQQHQAASATRKILKKITIKTVGAQPDIEKLIAHKNAHGENSVMPLMSVIGVASDFKPGQTDLGPYIKLLGMFKAINVETGELFVSGACIIPGSGNDLVYGQLKALTEGGSVEFAFRIGVRYTPNSKGGVPYSYDVEQVFEPSQADPLAALEAKISDVLSLPAPTAESESALVTQPAKASGGNKRK